ncbi:MAG TPA: penicillin-binding protein 2 [Pyrinomonadaceae bacterium]|jgi:penicillin-binding protein 2|nr:penicillin-binding protein 2 [Pyrinomonadaceae bacterium]
MKFEDFSQNLGIRIATIQTIAVILLTVLGVRLYFLQIVKGDYYSGKAENQRIRKIRLPAPRGAIFDRNGKLLVDSRSTYNVTLAREPIKEINPNDRVDIYAEALGMDKQYLLERLNLIRKQNEFETMVLKENATIQDITWVEAHSLEYPELQIQQTPQRRYPLGTTLAHVLGYVGEISPAQLEKEEYKDLAPGDVIGKGGLEAYYDKILRGKDGYKKVVVDSRGRVKEEIETVEPQAGQDMVTTIDLDLQIAAEEQLAKSVTKRGAIISLDPNNGEILAMASAPSYDPNVFVTGSATPEGRRMIAKYYTDPQKPLLNRAIQGRYPPGSTWKIAESVAGLQQGVITTKSNSIACGGGIQIGNRFTRDTSGNHGSPDLRTAITRSCDGYYYRLGLKMTVDGMIRMIQEFEYDKVTGIDLPNEKVSRTPEYYKPIVEKRDGRWPDIETVFASIGQVTVYLTPLAQIRAVSSVGVGGKLFVPHLLKEFREIGAVGEPDTSDYIPARPSITFNHPEPKIIEMTAEQNKMVVDGMWGVVNNGGTAHGIISKDLIIAGKTGTAQVAEVGKDTGANKDHSWFVSFAPAYKPQLSVIAIIENSGFGAANAAPAVKAVYESYLAKYGIPENQQTRP